VLEIIEPELAADEREKLAHSADRLKAALGRIHLSQTEMPPGGSGAARQRSRRENAFPPRMPLLELPERCADVGEREGRGDRHVNLAFGDQSGELRQDPGVQRLLAALGLDAVLLRGGDRDLFEVWYPAREKASVAQAPILFRTEAGRRTDARLRHPDAPVPNPIVETGNRSGIFPAVSNSRQSVSRRTISHQSFPSLIFQ
jgi:hypothetical protein